jgi:hypothetical protein
VVGSVVVVVPGPAGWSIALVRRAGTGRPALPPPGLSSHNSSAKAATATTATIATTTVDDEQRAVRIKEFFGNRLIRDVAQPLLVEKFKSALCKSDSKWGTHLLALDGQPRPNAPLRHILDGLQERPHRE